MVLAIYIVYVFLIKILVCLESTGNPENRDYTIDLLILYFMEMAPNISFVSNLSRNCTFMPPLICSSYFSIKYRVRVSFM